MFDKVLFLGQGGRTVYCGSVEKAEPFFAKIGYPLPPYVNPADFYMDVIAGSVKNERNLYTNLFEEWEKHQMTVEELGSEADSVNNDRSIEARADVNGVNEEVGSEEGKQSVLSSHIQSIESEASEDSVQRKMSSQILINVKEAHDTSDSTESTYYQCNLFPSFINKRLFTQLLHLGDANAMVWQFRILNWLVAASKLH